MYNFHTSRKEKQNKDTHIHTEVYASKTIINQCSKPRLEFYLDFTLAQFFPLPYSP